MNGEKKGRLDGSRAGGEVVFGENCFSELISHQRRGAFVPAKKKNEILLKRKKLPETAPPKVKGG